MHAAAGRRSSASTPRSTAATRSTRPRSSYERARRPRRGPAGRAALQRVEALGRAGRPSPRPDGRVVFDRLATFRRGTGAFTWTPEGAGHLHRAGRRRRSCAPAWASATATRPTSRWRTGRANALECGGSWRRARSSTRARAASARRASRRPPRAAAPTPGLRTVVLSDRPGAQPVRLARGRARRRAHARRARNLFGAGGAGAGGDGAPLGRRAGLARRPARRARRRPHLGRGADRAARAWTSCSRSCGSSATTRRASSTA